MLPPPHLGRVVAIHVEVARHARQEVAAHAVGEGDRVVARFTAVGGEANSPGGGRAGGGLRGGAGGAGAVGHGGRGGLEEGEEEEEKEREGRGGAGGGTAVLGSGVGHGVEAAATAELDHGR